VVAAEVRKRGPVIPAQGEGVESARRSGDPTVGAGRYVSSESDHGLVRCAVDRSDNVVEKIRRDMP
jgi:hypothetical protein